MQLRRMPAHRATWEVADLIYATCKAYLKQQGRFLLLLWAFIATIIVAYHLFLVDFDIAKALVEVDLDAKATPLHDATVVGDPFKDTSSVALNPVIKFTTLFGLLAVELAVALPALGAAWLPPVLAVVFFLVSAAFVVRSFYAMRINQIMEDLDIKKAVDPTPSTP